MKKILILVLCLLLCGCTFQASPEREETAAPSAPVQTAPAETIPKETAPAQSLPAETGPKETAPPEVSYETFVRVADFLPGIAVELKYATEDNFTGEVIYEFTDAYLRYGTVKKLAGVQVFLQEQDLSLKIWDAFRPVQAQFALWEAYPDGNFVANPNVTHSAHSRGNTLDVTIVDAQGRELEMPTAFDDFSSLADRDYSDCSLIPAENARLLESLMTQAGFTGYKNEWWHFTDTDAYPVEEDFTP